MSSLTRFRKAAVVYVLVALTTVAGMGSLVFFGWFLSRTKPGMVELDLSPPGSLLWDALLCGLFFVQHSGMVRHSFQEWSERWIPPHLYRAVYTLASAAALASLCLFWQPSVQAPLVLAGAPREILRGISLLALLGFAWAFVSLGGFDAFGTGAILARYRRRTLTTPQLAVKGPYRWVRHPFYFLAIVILWASPVLSPDRLLLNGLFTIWIVVGARWEERDLTAAFGEAYRRHQRAVPMLLPRWRPADSAGNTARG